MVIILGRGGHARVLAQFWGGAELVGTETKIDPESDVVIGIGNHARIGNSGLALRRKYYEQYAPRVLGVNAFDGLNQANVHRTVQQLHNVIVNVGASVRENTILNTGCIVEHDCVVGAHSHIAPGSILCGNVFVGSETHIGAGSVVIQGVHIGSGCVVAAGSVVTLDLPDGKTWLKGQIL